ncbi:hypothetical protein BDQ17DRAFT_1367197, partial [Cyathus striatus]
MTSFQCMFSTPHLHYSPLLSRQHSVLNPSPPFLSLHPLTPPTARLSIQHILHPRHPCVMHRTKGVCVASFSLASLLGLPLVCTLESTRMV